jgi:hypothetical protein
MAVSDQACFLTFGIKNVLGFCSRIYFQELKNPFLQKYQEAILITSNSNA